MTNDEIPKHERSPNDKARTSLASYLGAFIMYLSTVALLHAWFSLIATALILPFAFLRRIHYEEELLQEEFGSEYDAYCLKVKKILPGIW